MVDASDKIGCDARGGSRIMLGDESAEADQVGDGLLRIDKPHLSACGGGSSSEVPHDSSQA